jgi:hypothetical protein
MRATSSLPIFSRKALFSERWRSADLRALRCAEAGRVVDDHEAT